MTGDMLDIFKGAEMEQSITLLDRALQRASHQELAAAIGVNYTALSNSKKIGHLSPVVAGGIAVFLSENVEKWMAVAAIESARKGKARTLLEKHLERRVNR